MRRNWLVLAILAFACCLVVGVTAAAAAGEAPPASESTPPASEPGAPPPPNPSCLAGYVCSWFQLGFQGEPGFTLCTGGPHPLNQFKGSVKNRCANKASWLRINGVANECINAGGQDEITEFNELWIGAEGSHC